MNRFKRLRYERGLTQGDVALGTGLSRPTLRALETAENPKPSAPVAKALADFYELSVGDLLGLEDVAA